MTNPHPAYAHMLPLSKLLCTVGVHRWDRYWVYWKSGTREFGFGRLPGPRKMMYEWKRWCRCCDKCKGHAA